MFPPEGNFDIDAGDGGGWVGGWGDHLGPPKSQTNHTKHFVRKLFTLLGHVSEHCKQTFFDIFSYTQKTTLNPINASKITNYNTEHTTNTNIHFQQSNIFDLGGIFQKTKILYMKLQ